MTGTLRQWRATFAIYLQDGFAYRAAGFIWVLTDLATAVTMPLVWAASAGSGTIKGLDSGDFVLYYLGMLMMSSFITCHFMWEVAQEIKEGVFSVYLVRPISFFQFMAVRNFTWRVVRSCLFAPLFLTLLFLYRDYLLGATVYLGWELWLGIVLGHGVSFCFVIALSMLALYVQEATSIFELYYVPMLFLSGQLFPTSLLPDWAHTLSRYLPFYYTTGAPTDILVGRLQGGQAHQVLLIQAAWILASFFVHKVLWRMGLKQYSGVGM